MLGYHDAAASQMQDAADEESRLESVRDDGLDAMDNGQFDEYQNGMGSWDNLFGEDQEEDEEEETSQASDDEEGRKSIKQKMRDKANKAIATKMGMMLAAIPAPQYKCPKCRKKMIYFEPAWIKAMLDSAWSSVFMVRSQRWICLNPDCPMTFIKTRTRFRRGILGNLVPTHIFHEQVSKNPFMPI